MNSLPHQRPDSVLKSIQGHADCWLIARSGKRVVLTGVHYQNTTTMASVTWLLPSLCAELGNSCARLVPLSVRAGSSVLARHSRASQESAVSGFCQPVLVGRDDILLLFIFTGQGVKGLLVPRKVSW